jgi:hypothetical protein
MARHCRRQWLSLTSALAIACASGCGSNDSAGGGAGGKRGNGTDAGDTGDAATGTGGDTSSGGSGNASSNGGSANGNGGNAGNGGRSNGGGASGKGGSTDTGGRGNGGTGASGGTSNGGSGPTGGTSGSGAGGSGGSSNGALLHISPNKRYLMDANDKPFYLVGDTAWTLVPGLTVSQANDYFHTRASQGFNAVLMDADVQMGASPVGAPERGPADANGNKPFNGTLGNGTFDVSTLPTSGDTTSTAAKYWANVDAIVTAAANNGIQIIFDVYDDYNPWFGNDTSPNSVAKLQAYGEFLGGRYVFFDNIIWMIGNDYKESSGGDANLGAVIKGIRKYDGRHIGWAFDVYGAAFDDTGLRSQFALDTIYEYSAGPWRSIYLDQYNRSDFGPIVNIEAGYENNTSLGVSVANVRNEHYSFLLAGATGDTYGNEYVWPFANSWKNWQNALTSQGAHEVTYFTKLVNAIPWQNLLPDQDGKVFQGVGNPTDYSGAYTPDGTLALAYRPATGATSQSFNVKMSQFSGQVTARWYDPTAGTYTNIGSFPNSGMHTFDSPKANGAGDNDFVLVIQVP